MIDNRTAPYAALVLRLALSFFFFAHLVRKFAVIGFDPWWAGLVKQGYPGVVLAYTVAIEFAGALLLLLGVYTRYVSFFRFLCSLRSPIIGWCARASGLPMAAWNFRLPGCSC